MTQTMDRLGLSWQTHRKRSRKNQPLRYLEVAINNKPLTNIIADYDAQHGLETFDDDFILDSDFADVSKQAWSISCHDDTSIILLACSCGHWECSHLAVKSIQVANTVYWQFVFNQPHLKPYSQLPDYWFDANQYRQTVGRILGNNGVEAI